MNKAPRVTRGPGGDETGDHLSKAVPTSRRRHRQFLAVGVLALAVALTTVAFSLLSGAILRPLPIEGIESVANVVFVREGAISARGFTKVELDRVGVRTAGLFESSVGVATGPIVITRGNSSSRGLAEQVVGPYFDLLRIKPLLGSLPGLDQADSCCAVAISERLWRGRFSADPEIIGEVIRLDGQSFTVTGVVASAHHGVSLPQLMSVDVWFAQADLPVAERRALQVFSRLRSETSIESARAALRGLGRELFPNESGVGLDVQSAWRGMVPPPLVAIGAAVGTASLVVCVVVLLLALTTILCLSRASFESRRHEFAVRIALGATRDDLLRQSRREALAVTVPACVLGGGAASLLSKTLSAVVVLPAAGAFVPHIDATPDLRVLLFVVAALLATTSILARVQADSMWVDPNSLTKGVVRLPIGATGPDAFRPVVWQLATATALVLTAALFFRVSRPQAGGLLHAEHIVIADVQTKSPRAIDRAAMSGVIRVGLATALPLPTRFGIQRFGSAPRATSGRSTLVHSIGVSGDTLDMLSLTLIAGRRLTPSEGNSDEVVVDETTATRLWGIASGAVGQSAWFADSDRRRSVIGVVRSPFAADRSADRQSFVFIPIESSGGASFKALVSGPDTDQRLSDELRQYFSRVDPSALVFDPQPLSDYADSGAKTAAASMWPTMAAASLSLVMALAGLYGVISHDVNVRMAEFGVRIALGASSLNIASIVTRRCLRAVAHGTLWGIAAAIAIALVLPPELLRGLEIRDLGVLLLFPVAAFLTSMLAILPPTLRATRSDPISVMRA
ncbi:MAG: ABC transporter permease [Gemmatimonadaceae bacterium]|nr:ABC transporter permease [Gemmatimonadaceae bacterium]